MLADLAPVDCGSLDVLLYCPDDLAVAGRGDFESVLVRALPHSPPAFAAHAVSIGDVREARGDSAPLPAGLGLPAADVLDALFARLARREDDPLFHPLV